VHGGAGLQDGPEDARQAAGRAMDQPGKGQHHPGPADRMGNGVGNREERRRKHAGADEQAAHAQPHGLRRIAGPFGHGEQAANAKGVGVAWEQHRRQLSGDEPVHPRPQRGRQEHQGPCDGRQPPPGNEQDDGRPDQVELLLHAQGPEVGRSQGILPPVENLEVGDVQQVRRQQLAVFPDAREGRGADRQVVDGEDAQGATGVEAPQDGPGRASGAARVEKDAGDQVAAQDEEHLDAQHFELDARERAFGEPVVQGDGENGHGPQTVELRFAGIRGRWLHGGLVETRTADGNPKPPAVSAPGSRGPVERGGCPRPPARLPAGPGGHGRNGDRPSPTRFFPVTRARPLPKSSPRKLRTRG